MPPPASYLQILIPLVTRVVPVLLLASVLPAFADDVPQAQDRIAIDACMQKETVAPEHCIGIAYQACIEAPGSSSTAGMVECAWRETRVWDEKVDAALKQLLTGSLGKTEAQLWNRPPRNRREKAVPGSDILLDMQQTWLAWRAKKCDALSLQAEGGSLARVLYGTCFYDETGHHALWLLWLKATVDDMK
jgi:uncharacterized protein YecT (DUF1311 family)